jgi:hypothetical protein
MEFKDSINEHVVALQAACRDFMAKQGATNNPASREIRIDIRTGLDDPESPTRGRVSDDRSAECWEHVYVCGHFLNGEPYYCSVRVCMIVGPITVEPS